MNLRSARTENLLVQIMYNLLQNRNAVGRNNVKYKNNEQEPRSNDNL